MLKVAHSYTVMAASSRRFHGLEAQEDASPLAAEDRRPVQYKGLQ